MTSPLDLNDVADAIAAKFVALPGIKGSSTGNLDMPPNLPWVFVLNPALSLMERALSNERWDWVWPVLLMAPQYADLSRAHKDLRALVVPVLVAYWQGFKLGMDGIQDSYMQSATPDVVTIGQADNLPVYRFEIVTAMRYNITRTA